MRLIANTRTHSLDCSEAFGSKISAENIPGTPMEPDEYQGKSSSDHHDQMALISEGRRPSSLKIAATAPPATPQRENNLNNVMNSHDRSGEVVKFNLNHNHEPNNVVMPAGGATKRSSLSMSVLEIVDSRKNSKQDKEVSAAGSIWFNPSYG